MRALPGSGRTVVCAVSALTALVLSATNVAAHSDLVSSTASPFARPAATLDGRGLVGALAAEPLLAQAAPATDPDLPAAPAKRGPSPALAALRSMIVPGWGQLSTGHKTQAGVFLGLEVASWASYITFKRQGHLREESYISTARIYAGIDLGDQDERIRRYVGQYQSEEVYNQYVVRREAAFFIEDPAEQAQYIAENSLGGDQAWHWDLYDDFLRYRDQRQSSESAYHNAEFVVGFALANRLVSAVMAARQASSLRKAQAAAPVGGGVPGRPDGSFAWGVQPSLNGPLEGRVGWTVSF